MTIAVIGLGKLGLPFAASWAERGFDVIGVDINKDRVREVNSGKINDFEPGLKKLVGQNRDRLRATTNLIEAYEQSEAIFILVNTPGETSGKFTNQYVLAVAKELAVINKNTADKPLIVLASSVTPGSIEREILPVLGTAVDFCYSPVFIALGKQLEGYLGPDLALIGESSTKAGDRLESLWKDFFVKKTPIVRTSFINAEIIKLVLSTFVTTKISYANMLATLCDAIPGANVDEVASALGLDSRISAKVLKGGMPFGGPCFPRDNRALIYLMEQVGIDGSLVRATDTYNHNLVATVARRVMESLESNETVGVLGLSFKPDTDVVDESASLAIVNYLAKEGVKVIAYDPVAMGNATEMLELEAMLATSLSDCLTQSHTILIATPWDEFKKLPNLIRTMSKPRRVVDPWRLFKAGDFSRMVDYDPLGRDVRSTILTAESA